LLFIGSGIYFHRPHKRIVKLVKNLNPVLVKNAAAFGTYGNQSEVGEQIKILLLEQGVHVQGDPFTCKGDSIGTDNKGHPNISDLENAKEFAKKIFETVTY